MSFSQPSRRALLAATGGLAVLPGFGACAETVPDEGWRLWVDEKAAWTDDAIHLPGEFTLASLPVNPPTGGWEMLGPRAGRAVTLPATVEQFDWGRYGTRPYTMAEYAWASRDPIPRNGAYRGVSWWWRQVAIPRDFAQRRILLTVRGARQRAEVYLNRKLVGYSILAELPFTCDLSEAAIPGGDNQLAIRITNPGGRYDWVDGDTIEWGKVKIQSGHGFGGLDRGMTLEAHPKAAHIADLWVLNTPRARTVTAFVAFAGKADAKNLSLTVTDADGAPVAATIRAERNKGARKFTITCADARVWDLETPHLYRLTARWRAPDGGESVRDVTFGFRWFAPDGVGTDALLRLNGRRIRLYSAISWGYWGLNGLWPVPDLAEKEVRQARAMGLNCLNFHRNPGRSDVLAAQDRLGLLRVMEPGGGKYAMGRWPDNTKADANSIIMEPAVTEADKFCQRYVIAKCVAMVRAFRSHPSLVQYTVQNEAGADFANPATVAIMDRMRAEDPSRIILMNDGLVDPPTRAAQAWYEPYNGHLHRSDREEWGGWWDQHQGAGDQWYDRFYRNPRDYIDNQTFRPGIVEYGEMEGCAVPDNHVLAIADILQRGGHAYDLGDHREILAAYDAFLDKWKFRAAFARTESLFTAIGHKSFDAWQQYMENVRINDACDFAAISGWESTAIENHSGLVDNLRNPRTDPAIIRASLLPLRALAKQRALVVAKGAPATFDLWLLNDTGEAADGLLDFRMTDPAGNKTAIGTFRAMLAGGDRFSALAGEAVQSPPLTKEGMYRFTLSMPGVPDHVRDILVVDDRLPSLPDRTLTVAVLGVLPVTRAQLGALSGVVAEDYAEGRRYDAIVVSGLTGKSTEAQRLGGDEGVTLQKANNLPLVPGEVPQSVIVAAQAGTPLLVIAQEDGLADGLATQLAAAGAFSYRGQVGRTRAPWMGSWCFLRAHPAYEGLPANQAMGLHYQTPGRLANGLLVDGEGVDVFVGYSRDHDRQVGAGTFTARLGKGKLLFQRLPDLNGPMQQRFLRNALAWLCA
jgi:hypothetical protein